MASLSAPHEQIGAWADDELAGGLSGLVQLRWLAATGLLVATGLVAGVWRRPLLVVPLLALGVATLAYNALARWALLRLNISPDRSSAAYRRQARIQIGLDWALLALVTLFSGGLESPALFGFLGHVAIVFCLLPHVLPPLWALVTPLLVGLAAIPALVGALPARGSARDPLWLAGVWLAFTISTGLLAHFSLRMAQRLRRREHKLLGLYESVQATALTLDLSEVLNRLAEATARALGCKGAAIRLLDKSGSLLELAAACGLSEAYVDKGPVELTRSRIDQEVLSGHTLIVHDAALEPRLQYREKVVAEGIRSILIAPLIGKRGPVGVLRAYDAEAYRFTDDDAAFLSLIAAQGALAIENAQAYQLLESLDRSKSQFVRMVTHELRSPIQVASSLLNVLEHGYVGALNEKQADLVDRAFRRLQFLQLLIDDLLDLAAGRADVLATAERGPVALCDVMREVRLRFEEQARTKGIALRVGCPREGLNIWGNRAELDRIMNNLVSNAVKYTQKGEVRIFAERGEGVVRIVVSDTGIGIPEEAMPHLFEEFYRAPNAKATSETGTGLGLAIVKDLIERYDGHIEVKSKVGVGTTFTITLPTVEA